MSRLGAGVPGNFPGGSSTQNVNLIQVGSSSFSLGQQLAASSLPVVLTASQLSTLTPPAAITNFALETGGNLATLAGAVTASVVQANVKQINGVAVTMGNGVSGTGVQRVTIASDSTGQVALATGSNTVGSVKLTDGTNTQTLMSTTTTSKFGADVNILSILGTAPTTAGFIDIKGADGNVFVRQTTGSNLHMVVDSGTITSVTGITNALPAGTNNIGVIDIADTGGNKFTSNSTTYTAKFGLDVNLLGTLGTAFSTAGKIDVKGADGDVFVRQSTASNLNATVVGTGTFAVQATEATLDAAIVSQGTALGTIKHLMTAGSVTTNAPTYTTGNINPLSLTTAGGLRIDLKDTASNSNNLNVNLAASAATVTVSATNLSTNIAQINGVTPLMGNGTTGTGSLRVTVASDNTAFAVNATLSAETTKVIGTVRNLGNAGATLDAAVGAGTAPTNMLAVGGLYNSTEISPTTGQSAALQLDAKGRLRQVIMDAAGNTRGANVDANNNLGVVLAAETTKVLGVTRTADGSGNLLTSNSTTYTAKFGLDVNILGTLGTAFSTAGKVDVKSADGDVFVRSNAGSTFPVNATLQTQTDTVMVGGVNVKEINGVTPLMGNGVTGTGSLRVTIASDNTANSNPFLVTQSPATSGGLTIYRLLSAATTNGNNIKASAGQIYGWVITNTNASARFVKLYNKATAPTVGTDTPVITLVIPGNATGSGMVAAEFTSGIAFGTGIGIGITTAVADADTGAVAANEVVCNILYK